MAEITSGSPRRDAPSAIGSGLNGTPVRLHSPQRRNGSAHHPQQRTRRNGPNAPPVRGRGAVTVYAFSPSSFPCALIAALTAFSGESSGDSFNTAVKSPVPSALADPT